jgi:hypothetical protein
VPRLTPSLDDESEGDRDQYPCHDHKLPGTEVSKNNPERQDDDIEDPFLSA